MRRQVTRVAVIATVVAMTLFAVPLALVSRSLLLERELAELEVSALAATRTVTVQVGDAVELPAPAESSSLALYDAGGRLVVGGGPPRAGAAATAALNGHATRDVDGDRLVATVPVIRDERVVGAVEASESAGEVWRQVAIAWTLLGAGAVIAIAVGLLVARRRARILLDPLEALTATAVRIRDGDLSARSAPSDIAELDALARAHNALVDSLGDMLERERRFSADVSHQLRTPLSRLRLRLEGVDPGPTGATPPWVHEARSDVARLEETVRDILDASRAGNPAMSTISAQQPVTSVIEALEARWIGPLAKSGRRLDVEVVDQVSESLVAGAVVGHVLDVLVENALTHGRGRVRVSARDLAGALVLDVEDEGEMDQSVLDPFIRGLTTGDGAGVGLSLARTMAAAAGGRLVLGARAPTRFSVFLSLQDAEALRPTR